MVTENLSQTTHMMIRPVDTDVFTDKFQIEGRLDPEATGVFRHLTLRINFMLNNADVDVPSFFSVGADKTPPEYTLETTWFSIDQFEGFPKIIGHFGTGNLHVKTDKGVIIEGVIFGGPCEEQAFIASGVWISS